MERRAKAAGRVSRDVLLDASLPQATKTYTVISHKFVIDTLKEKLDARGFVITNEIYSATDQAQIAYGIFHINYGNDPELGMMLAFQNSYNKQLKFSCAVGAFVKTNDTSILSKENSAWVRMHTGTADEEAAEVIEEQVKNAEGYFQQLADDKAAMQNIKISRREYGELLGRLFVDVKVLGMEQISLSKKEFEKPSFNYTGDPESLWTMYNHILVALAKSHPRTWMEQQKLVHFHIMTEFDFVVFDPEPIEIPGLMLMPAVNTTDPNQTSLIDQAAEVEEAQVENIMDLPVDENIEGMSDEEIADWNAMQAEAAADEEILTEAIEEPVVEEPVEEPKPSISMKDAIAKYGHLITDEQAESLMKGERDEESINTLKSAYLADQEKEAEEAFVQEGAKVMTAGEPTAHVESDEAYAERVAEIEGEPEVKPAGPKVIINKISLDEPIDLTKDPAEMINYPPLTNVDGSEPEPFTEEKFAEVNNEISEGMILPQAPGTAQAEIETPEGEGVVVDVDESVEDSVDVADFSISRSDVQGMYPDVELEVGLVLHIGDDECEIINFETVEGEELIGLSVLTEEELVEANESAEDVASQIEESQTEEPVDMDFDIDDAVVHVPSDSMLKTQSSAVEDLDDVINEDDISPEKAAEIERAMEIMNSKVELSPAEQAIHDAINIEVIDLYGSKFPFTFKLSGDQYTVQLESGESFILAAAYVESLKEEV